MSDDEEALLAIELEDVDKEELAPPHDAKTIKATVT
jgi:hypothetical protein